LGLVCGLQQVLRATIRPSSENIHHCDTYSDVLNRAATACECKCFDVISYRLQHLSAVVLAERKSVWVSLVSRLWA
jgi:hypothetical protein